MQKNISDIKVFISRGIPSIAMEMLRSEGFSVSAGGKEKPMEQAALIAEAKKCNALLSILTDKIDAYFLNECSHLEIISQFGAGYDNIDVPAATALGIPVGNTPGAMSEATADIAFGLMIAVSRKFFFMHKKIEKGEWSFFNPTAHLGFELKNKTLGIFGLGRIGIEMAQRCKGSYNMNILYCNRSRNEEAENILQAKKVSFDELLQQSDIISVHSVLSSETKGIFSKDAFRKMKRNAIFINTSRGGVHNEEDLIEALQQGAIWGAGLDVTNPEPMRANNPLLNMENVAVLPHIGSATVEARTAMSAMAAQNIIEFYKHGSIPHIINPEVLK